MKMAPPSETFDLFEEVAPVPEQPSAAPAAAAAAPAIDPGLGVVIDAGGDEAQNDAKVGYWPDNLRQVPNALIRCGLFTVGNNKQERKVWRAGKAVTIESYGALTVSYYGEEFRQDDLDVLLEMLQVSRGQSLSEALFIRPMHLISDMGWSKNSASYERLRTCIKRLQGGVLSITMYLDRERKESVTYNGNLILGSVMYENEQKRVNDRWQITLNPKLMRFFDANAFTRINWAHRREISSPLGKFLHAFFASHDGSFPIHWRKIMTISGYRANSDSAARKFKQDLMKYLARMKEMGAIVDFRMDDDECVRVKPVKWTLLATKQDQAKLAAAA